MFKIRIARVEDAREILDIYRPYIEESATSFESVLPSVNEMEGRIRNCLEEHCWLVWEDEGRIRGYAYASQYHPRAAYRWTAEVSIYIDKQYHGRGAGKILYQALFQILRLQGYYNAYACICLPNDASVGIHESFGFKLAAHDHQIGYKFGQWWDTGWWELFLKDKQIIPSEPLPLCKLNPHDLEKILSDE